MLTHIAYRHYQLFNKVLTRVIPNSTSLLAPLDEITAGRDSKETVTRTDEFTDAFTKAQTALLSIRSITALDCHRWFRKETWLGSNSIHNT